MTEIQIDGLKFKEDCITVGVVDRWLAANRGNPDFGRACAVLAEVTESVPEEWGDPSNKSTFYNLHFSIYRQVANQFSQYLNALTSKN